jgi:hypothetical protein
MMVRGSIGCVTIAGRPIAGRDPSFVTHCTTRIGSVATRTKESIEKDDDGLLKTMAKALQPPPSQQQHSSFIHSKQNNRVSCFYCLFLTLSLVAALVLVGSSHRAIILVATTTQNHGGGVVDPSGAVLASLMLQSEQASTLVVTASSRLIDQLSTFAQSFNDSIVDDVSKSPLLFQRPTQPIVIAYVVTFPHKCESGEYNSTAWMDSILVLRHSIHLTSVRGNAHSHYDYRLVAIVETKAEASCSPVLHQSGAFHTVMIKDPPIYGQEIVGEKGSLARKTLHRKGTTEFLPLYIYEMTDYPTVVHVEWDTILTKPLDDVLDAFLYHPQSNIGRTARERVALEQHERRRNILWPDNVQAALTLDWPQVMPGRKPGVRPGLLIVKPNVNVYELIIDVIRQGDYVDGHSRDNGWGGLGHGGYAGALGLSGLLAFVYEALLYDTWVELNQCRYNHVGMDVLYRAPPSFQKSHAKVGQCRNDGDYCEDCMSTSPSQLHSVRFGEACPRPWHCIGEGSRSRHDKTGVPEEQVNLPHCLELQGIWHGVRRDLEAKLYDLTNADTIREAGQAGDYLSHVYSGHCHSYGANGYLKIAASVRTMQRVPDLYK